MSDKATSSGTIKTFAKIIFVIGIIFTVIITLAMIICGIKFGKEYGAGATVGSILVAIIFCVIMIFLLAVEKAFLMTYAEIGEDMREVRNILARRDEARN